MKSMKRRVAGLVAKRAGQTWESRFHTQCRARGVDVVRVPDGCRQAGATLHRVKTPFDWVLGFKGQIAFVDTKSLSNKSLRYSDIVPHQLASLMVLGQHCGKAGYAVWFRDVDNVVFFNFPTLCSLMPGDSLCPVQGRVLGSMSTFDPTLIW